MFRMTARLAALCLPVALAACGSSREDELEKQLAQAQATAAEEAAALKAQQEASAARAKDNDQSLAAFYAGDGGSEDSAPNEDLGGPAPEAPEAPPPPPADMPPGPPLPAPQ
ncbi:MULTISPECIES: hypothetical protein [unclassified Novosphingobium]|uniref:hypothetical protein n=2 Tax=unclassified Novosphingobium TaxID=2644732 RepID=UPI00190F2954